MAPVCEPASRRLLVPSLLILLAVVVAEPPPPSYPITRAGCIYRDAAANATYDLTSVPSPLKVSQGCLGAPGPGPLGPDCRRSGAYHWLGFCGDVAAPAGAPAACPAPAAAAFHVGLDACHTMGAGLADALIEALPYNRTGVRISYRGGSPGCTTPPGHFNLVLSLECGEAPVAAARALSNDPVPADMWYYAHPTYMSPDWVGCGHTVKLRDPRFCPLECPRGPRGEVCGGAHAGACEARAGEGARCWCFSGHAGPACAPARQPHPAPPLPPPPRASRATPFSRVNGSACQLLDGDRALQYDLTGLPRTFNVRERDEGPVWIGRDGWHYYLTLCARGRTDCGGSPGGSAGGVSSIEQMTGVQYADHFEQHQCFSSGGDFQENSVAYPLEEEGALGMLVRVGGGDTCGGAGYRITLLRLECDAAPPPVPRYGAQRRGLLLTGAEPTPSDIWSAVYEHAPPDRVHNPGDGSCEYTIHLRGPHFCPVQCPRAANGVVCGGAAAGRCFSAGATTKCWCFLGWGGAACDEPREVEQEESSALLPPQGGGGGSGGGSGGGGGGGGGGGTVLRGPSSGRPWLLMRFAWLSEDGGADTLVTFSFLVVVALHAACGAAVAAALPKDASSWLRGVSWTALFAAALLLLMVAARAARGGSAGCTFLQ
jgi:hypothetical protein